MDDKMKRPFFIMVMLMASLFNTAQAQPLTIGDLAPEFNLTDQYGHTHSIHDYAGKWVVLYFYPKDDTPGCIKEACEFRDEYRVIKAKNTEVLGVSMGSEASHAKFAEKYHLPFSLLVDEGGKVAKQYQALFSFWPITLTKRHSFIIDPDGIIQQIYRRVDPNNHGQEIIADLKRLQLELVANPKP